MQLTPKTETPRIEVLIEISPRPTSFLVEAGQRSLSALLSAKKCCEN